MALEGYRVATSATGTNWTTPTNVYTSNDADATFTAATQDYLEVEAWGFAVPTNAIVRGVEVTVEGSSATSRTVEVFLTKNGTATAGTSKTQALTGTDAVYVLGGAADLWGTTWDVEEINATTFGVFLRDNAASASDLNIDHIQVRVYYDNGAQAEWDIDFDSLEITHIDHYWDYDGGTGGTAPSDGDVIFDTTTGATGRILGVSAGSVLAFGTLAVGETHGGAVANNDSLEVCSFVNFDTEQNGGPDELDIGLALTGGTLSGATVRHVETDGVNGRLWYTATSGSLADGNTFSIAGTAKADANGASVDNAWTGSANGAEITHAQGWIPLDTITVTFENVTGGGRLRDAGFQHNLCVLNTVNDATAFVVDIRVDQNDSSLATLYLTDMSGDWSSAGIDDDQIIALEEVSFDAETTDIAVGNTIADAASPTHTWAVRRLIRNGAPGNDGVCYVERLTGTARFANNDAIFVGAGQVATADGAQRQRVGTGLINTVSGYTASNVQWLSSHLYTETQRQFPALLNMDDLVPLSAQVRDQQYTGINSWVVKHYSTERLAKGAVQQHFAIGAADDDDVYTNDAHLGSLNGAPNLYVEQNNSVLAQFWDAGPMDVLLRNKTKNGLVDSGIRRWYARPFGDLYDWTELNSVGLARPVPLNTRNDLDNATAYATVRDTAVYHAIEVAWASHTIDFDGGAGGTFHAGDVLINTSRTPDQGVMVARVPNSFTSGTDLHIAAHGQDISAWVDTDALEVANYVDFDTQVAGQSFSVGTAYQDTGDTWNFVCVWVQQFGASRGRLWYKTTSGSPTNNMILEPDGGGTDIATVDGSEVVRAGWTGTANGVPPETADTTALLDTGAGGSNPYNVHFVLNGATIAQYYEFLKLITEERAGSTTDPGSLHYPNNAATQGRLYREADSAYGVSDLNKQSPFGSKAGATFFGARGVFISGMASADVQNFSLIDANGSVQVPPNTQSITVSNLESGYAVGVYVRPDLTASLTYNDNGGAGDSEITQGSGDFAEEGFVAGEDVIVTGTTSNNGTFAIKAVAALTLTLDGIVLTDEGPVSSTLRGSNVNRRQYTDGTGNNSGDGDYVISGSIDAWLPSTGTLIVTSTNGQETASGGYEDQYAYTSYSGSTFTLSSTLVRTYSTDARAYVPMMLTTTAATSESVTFTYSTDIPVLTNARKKGFLPFGPSLGIAGTSGLSVAIVRQTDTIVE